MKRVACCRPAPSSGARESSGSPWTSSATVASARSNESKSGSRPDCGKDRSRRETVPAGFDYDFWLGQTPDVPYVKERTHFSFRYWWEYSGGTMTDWGAHHNDIVLWALDQDGSGPVSIEGKQLVEMIPGGYTAASEYEVTYTYANGVVHSCKSTTGSEWWGGVKDPNGQQHGIKFIGSDGWIWVTRGALQASDPAIIKEELPASASRVYVSRDHTGNFIECIKSRKPTICPASVGHRSASLCHLGVTSIRLGRKLNWDPVKEQFVDDAEANQFLARPMRKPYDYDMLCENRHDTESTVKEKESKGKREWYILPGRLRYWVRIWTIEVACVICVTHSSHSYARPERSFSAGTLPILCPLPANMYDSPFLRPPMYAFIGSVPAAERIAAVRSSRCRPGSAKPVRCVNAS